MFAFIGNIGPWELIIILLIALVVVGPGKLPEVARSMGRALNEFRRTTTGVKREFEDALKFEEPAPSKKTKASPGSTAKVEDRSVTNADDDAVTQTNDPGNKDDGENQAETEEKNNS